MSQQQYASPQEARIGRTKGAILSHAIPVEVLGITGEQHKLGKNMSDTVVFRRWLPRGGTTTGTGQTFASNINNWDVDPVDHITSEGVTPASDTITAQDITVQMNQFACLYQYTDKIVNLYEDDVPRAVKVQVGERMGLVRELIRYGALKGSTNKFFVGGSSRAAVNGAITLGKLRAITKSIIGNRGKLVKSILDASENYNTSAVEAAFCVFVHSDAENDIRELPGFIEAASYGTRNVMHEMELGSVDRYRFIISPELAPIPDSGAAVAGTGLVSTTGTSVDVYPYVVIGRDYWGDVALRGSASFDVTDIAPGKKDKSDPLGQRGYCGAKFWSASFIQNDGWGALLEAGVTDL